MGEVVNLRRARKLRDRAVKATSATANRVTYGVSKTDRAVGDAANLLRERSLDGARREDDS